MVIVAVFGFWCNCLIKIIQETYESTSYYAKTDKDAPVSYVWPIQISDWDLTGAGNIYYFVN